MDENALRWFLVNLSMINALGDFEENIVQAKFGEYPLLSSTTRGFVFGHDNRYQYSYFNGIYGRCDNSEHTAYYSAVNYCIIKKCQRWQGGSVIRSNTLCDAILEKNVNECKSQDVIAQLVKEEMISVQNGVLKANFPTFTSKENYRIRNDLKPIAVKIVDCMDKICTGAAALFKKHTPKELREHCEQLAYVRYQADAIGIIVENLVADGYLTIPEKRENLCVYGVKLAENK